MNPTKITVSVTIISPIEKVWQYFTEPRHIELWNNASLDWHTPKATNDLKIGGRFNYRMEAIDKSQGFNFEGTYTKIVPKQYISYEIDGGRKVDITFSYDGEQTTITEIFEAETENPIEMQKAGWQSILNNLKSYIEKFNVK